MAEHAVLEFAMGQERVLDMDIADMAADGVPGLLRRLAEEAIGVVDIPEDADSRMVDGFEQGFESAGFGIDAIGLDQDGDVFPLGIVGQRGERTGDDGIVHRRLDLGGQVAEHPDEGDTCSGREVDVFKALGENLLAPGRILQAAARGKAGQLEAEVLQALQGAGQLFRRERQRPRRMELLAQAADFDAIKPKVFGHSGDFDPGPFRTTNGGKCDLQHVSNLPFRNGGDG